MRRIRYGKGFRVACVVCGIGGCFCDDGHSFCLSEGGDLLLLGFYTSRLRALELDVCYMQMKEGISFSVVLL